MKNLNPTLNFTKMLAQRLLLPFVTLTYFGSVFHFYTNTASAPHVNLLCSPTSHPEPTTNGPSLDFIIIAETKTF